MTTKRIVILIQFYPNSNIDRSGNLNAFGPSMSRREASQIVRKKLATQLNRKPYPDGKDMAPTH